MHLTTRQELAQQLASFIRQRGGWATNPLPLQDLEHLRFEVRLSDRKLASDLDRLGFELRLLSQSTRVDPGLNAGAESLREAAGSERRRRTAAHSPCTGLAEGGDEGRGAIRTGSPCGSD